VKLLLANPNATDAVTKACAELARAAAAPDTDIVSWTNRSGPPVVDSFYGDAMAARPLAQALAALTPVPDGVVLAGFGSYGTNAVKEVLDVPVVSLAEAAMAYAVPLCHRFAIVTTSSRMIAYTEDLVQALGFSARCAAVRAVELPPLGAPEPSAEELVTRLAAEAAATGAELVILGGSRLSPHAAALRVRTAVTVVEPVACAVTMAESLVRIGLRQSKAGKFGRPPRPLADYR
jgi:allantoin racemase